LTEGWLVMNSRASISVSTGPYLEIKWAIDSAKEINDEVYIVIITYFVQSNGTKHVILRLLVLLSPENWRQIFGHDSRILWFERVTIVCRQKDESFRF